MILPVIDSHAHLFMKEFEGDLEEVLVRARKAGIEAIVNIGIDPETSRLAVESSRPEEGLHATAGLHPATPFPDLEGALLEIRRLAAPGPRRVIAIGEIGLDYHWKDVEPDVQGERLLRQIDLALELDLPVVIHCREALDDLLRILRSLPRIPPGVFHCFAGGALEAREVLALGFHISFAGNVTYPKAEDLQEAARSVPLDRLLLETDSPFLAPQGRRGRCNEPAFGILTRDFLAGLRGLDPAELDRRATEATKRLFRL